MQTYMYNYVTSHGMIFISYGLCNEFEKFLTHDLSVSTGYTLDTTRHIKQAMASYWDVDWVLLGLCSRRLF